MVKSTLKINPKTMREQLSPTEFTLDSLQIGSNDVTVRDKKFTIIIEEPRSKEGWQSARIYLGHIYLGCAGYYADGKWRYHDDEQKNEVVIKANSVEEFVERVVDNRKEELDARGVGLLIGF